MKPCRLCLAPTVPRFTLEVLARFPVQYSECAGCGSLQSDTPFWLEQTYGSNLPNSDQGAARRALRSCAIVLLTLKLLGLPRSSTLLDFGGGDGLVARLMRDAGVSASVYDPYVKNFYADGYASSLSDRPQVIVATEVWEHLADPKQEIGAIFQAEPRLVIVSTYLYTGQGQEWPYLGADHGGHVFFFSHAAMQQLGASYGYDVFTRGTCTIFSKKTLSPFHHWALRRALSQGGILLGKVWLQTIRPKRQLKPDAPVSISPRSQGKSMMRDTRL